MEMEDRRSVIEVARNAEEAMKAARNSVKAGGTKEDAEAAALAVLSSSFANQNINFSVSGEDSVSSAKNMHSNDSLQSSLTDQSHMLAKSQAAMFAAMALAPTILEKDENSISRHSSRKPASDSSFPIDVLIETTARGTAKGDDGPSSPLSPPSSSRPPLRRDPSGSHGNLLAYHLEEKKVSPAPTTTTEVSGGASIVSSIAAESERFEPQESPRRDPKGSTKGLVTGKKKKKKSKSMSSTSSRSIKEPKASKIKKEKKKEPRATRLRIQYGDKAWVSKGYRAVEPPIDNGNTRCYFSSLNALYQQEDLASLSSKGDMIAGTKKAEKRVVSVCIPCFNEESSSLIRTIRSLTRSYLPPGVVLEILVVVDGTKQISESMAAYIQKNFGIAVKDDDPKKNPFVTFPTAQTIVVENVSNGDVRVPASLLIKRTNKRKVNSQKWWLYAHAKDVGAEFVFATDCGIVFDRKCLLILLERMNRQPNCNGLTGYQRVMPAQMQGDSSFELCTDPMGWFLRQLQSFDFEMSQSTTKSLVDSLGFVPVLPGPCSLFRYAAFVSVSREYFQLTTMDLKGDSSDLVLGNVQLAEDRFPPVLLSFGTVDEEETPDYGAPGAEEEKGMKLPVTGFEHDAIFYFEAEKPLGQLVRQRRRWINGAYMAAYWALRGGWIGRSKQPMLFKIGAAAVLLFEVLQGAMIRTIIPATLSCGLFFMVSIIPSIYQGDAQLVEEKMNGDLDDTTYLLMGCTAAGVYLGGFLIFMIAHTPRAVANEGSKPGEIVSYHIDTKSAYRPWVFAMGFVLNFILTVMFFYVGYGVYTLIGWADSPLYFRMLTCLIGFPYMVALLDGIINSAKPSFKAFINLVLLTPVFLTSSLWFYVWFPCYASARISDLSWGNRAAHEDSSTSLIARHRAYVGRIVSVSIVLCNVLLAVAIIFFMNYVEQILTIILFTLLGFNILLHVVNLLDMIWRLFRHTIPYWLFGSPPPTLNLRAANVDQEDGVYHFDDESSEGSQDFDEVFTYAVDNEEKSAMTKDNLDRGSDYSGSLGGEDSHSVGSRGSRKSFMQKIRRNSMRRNSNFSGIAQEE